MIILPEKVKLHGVGFRCFATLIKRNEDVAMYERDDDVIEVFFRKYRKERNVFDKTFPEAETYPCNEDFGFSAWNYLDMEKAEKKYNKLVESGLKHPGHSLTQT